MDNLEGPPKSEPKVNSPAIDAGLIESSLKNRGFVTLPKGAHAELRAEVLREGGSTEYVDVGDVTLGADTEGFAVSGVESFPDDKGKLSFQLDSSDRRDVQREFWKADGEGDQAKVKEILTRRSARDKKLTGEFLEAHPVDLSDIDPEKIEDLEIRVVTDREVILPPTNYPCPASNT